MHILLVEDDSTLSMGLEYSLKKEGYNVNIGQSFKEGKNLIDENIYDLIILDIGLPDGSGFDLCKHIRKTKDTPVIFLTAEDEEVNVVMGLDMGADDYITKPFRINELLSRIKAILRRVEKNKINKNIYVSGNLKLITKENKLTKNGLLINLTPSEYKLIILLMENDGQVLERNLILERLWDVDQAFVDDNTLSVYIKRIREKIEDDSSKPEYIKTIRGTGYIWSKEVFSYV